MTILADWQIRSLCDPGRYAPLLTPFSEGVQEGGVISYGLTHGGYDFRLGHNLVYIFKNSFNEIISPKRMRADPLYLSRVFDRIDNLEQGQPVVIPPGGYILGYTLEYIRMPIYLKGRCVGKSSLARCGVFINTTPLECGWEGHLTLEIGNISPCPVEVYAGEGIAQLELEKMDSMPQKHYGEKHGKYMSQGPSPIPAKVKE